MTNHDLAQTRIDLLRHGECEGGHIFRGSSDVALTPNGLKQMQQRFQPNECDYDVIVSSSLKRCYAFSTQLNKQISCPLVREDNIQEINFGDWEGKNISDVERQDSSRFKQWQANPFRYCAPNGERFEVFRQRITRTLNHIVSEYRGKNVLVVTHGGVIKVLLSTILGSASIRLSAIDVPYACLSRIHVYHKNGEAPFLQLFAHNVKNRSALS